MKQILLATHNQGKIKRYQTLFNDLPKLKIVTLKDLNITLKVDEPFSSPQENSAHKAKEYGQLTAMPTIAIDEAVHTSFLPADEQPGVFVRRFKNQKELTDLEVLEVWQKIFTTYQQSQLEFIWDFRLSYYDPQKQTITTIKAEQRDEVMIPFSKIIDPGYPMSSFLIPKGYDRPYSELGADEYAQIDRRNLKPFFNFIKKLIK